MNAAAADNAGIQKLKIFLMVNIRNLQGWLYSTSPQAEIKK